MLVTKPMSWARISWRQTFFGVQIPKDYLNQENRLSCWLAVRQLAT